MPVMKVLLDHSCPFFLAHGGVQVQIEQTKAALEQVGVEVEYLRWWDDAQTGDVIHCIGRPDGTFVDLAQQKGIKVVAAELMGGLSIRPRIAHAIHRMAVRFVTRYLPQLISAKMGWSAFGKVDAFVSLTTWEARLLGYVFGVPTEKIQVIPNGVEQVFFDAIAEPRSEWLVCTSTVRDIKRTLELAEAATLARTPLWIIGRPYSEDDPYFLAFRRAIDKSNGIVRYEGPVSDRTKLAKIYRQARGFVLLSRYESLSLSALEAAAGECPLLLSDLPWARHSFGNQASYCPVTKSIPETARVLKKFYQEAPGIAPPPRPKTWLEVAADLKAVYQKVLREREESSTSR